MTIGERIRKAVIEFMQRHDPNRAETERIWRNKEAEREWRKERSKKS